MTPLAHEESPITVCRSAGMFGRSAIDPMQRIGTSALYKAFSRKKTQETVAQ